MNDLMKTGAKDADHGHNGDNGLAEHPFQDFELHSTCRFLDIRLCGEAQRFDVSEAGSLFPARRRQNREPILQFLQPDLVGGVIVIGGFQGGRESVVVGFQLSRQFVVRSF